MWIESEEDLWDEKWKVRLIKKVTDALSVRITLGSIAL